MSGELLTFNGVDGSTGSYLLSPMSPTQVSRMAGGESPDPAHLSELRWWYRRVTEASFGPKEGVEPKDLAQAGWGVIFAHDADPQVRQVLRPLLEHRRAQAGRVHEHYYREFAGERGYRPGESKQEFLARQRAGPGPADPENVPYYLLVVGSPESIPYAFQYQLDVQYAVGRIHFDRLEDYANYATSVVAAETGGVQRPRRVTLFAARNPGDRATELSAAELVTPLLEQLSQYPTDWEIQGLIGEGATKARLAQILGSGGQAPALLFSATHGVGFPNGHPHQLRRQGALLCQEWPGPDGPAQPLDEAFYFSGDDLAADAQVAGLISFHFACYGAGTPAWDDFAHSGAAARQQLAPHAFVAALPQRLLSHPGGGALAVIGHVDRAWGYSFVWPQAGRQTEAYTSCLARLLSGHPIGSAFEYFNERYAELASDLSVVLEDVKCGKRPDHLALAAMWTANNDARDFTILGDPAVRLVSVTAAEAHVRLTPEIAAVPRHPTLPGEPQPEPQTEPQPERCEEPVPVRSGPAVPTEPHPSSRGEQEPADVDFALRDGMRQARERLMSALQTLTETLGAVLEQAVDNVTVVEVATYVSDDLATATYDKTAKQFGGGAKLRALSRIHIAGDALLLVPEDHGDVDGALWTLHLGMVEQARAARAELLKTAGSALAGLLDAAKAW
ncbi:MAG: hypothetical protein ACRDYX_02485 [Egibacteraceae bacterium]